LSVDLVRTLLPMVRDSSTYESLTIMLREFVVFANPVPLKLKPYPLVETIPTDWTKMFEEASV
jgi:hypothetical protein